MCDTDPEPIFEDRNFLEKTLDALYILDSNSPDALDIVLLQEVLPVEVPSSVAKVAASVLICTECLAD